MGQKQGQGVSVAKTKNGEESMKKIMRVMLGLMTTVCMTVNASVIWSDNFNGYANTNGFVTAANPAFKSGMSTGQWARGESSVTLIDKGGGDKAISWTGSANSAGFAIWLSVTNLNLAAGTTYSLKFDIANFVGSAVGSPDGFGNVIKAKGVDAGGTVTLDLLKGANFDPTVSSGGALIGTSGTTTNTSIAIVGTAFGAVQFSQDGSYTVDFTVNSGDEYIGLVIGSQDRNTATQVKFDLDNVSVIPEPATVGMLGLGALTALLIRRKLVV